MRMDELSAVFHLCDSEGKGYVTLDDFRKVSSGSGDLVEHVSAILGLQQGVRMDFAQFSSRVRQVSLMDETFEGSVSSPSPFISRVRSRTQIHSAAASDDDESGVTSSYMDECVRKSLIDLQDQLNEMKDQQSGHFSDMIRQMKRSFLTAQDEMDRRLRSLEQRLASDRKLQVAFADEDKGMRWTQENAELEKSSLRLQISSLKERLAHLTQELDKKEGQLNIHQTDNEELRKKLNQTQIEMHRLDKENLALRLSNESLKEKNEHLHQKMEQERSERRSLEETFLLEKRGLDQDKLCMAFNKLSLAADRGFLISNIVNQIAEESRAEEGDDIDDGVGDADGDGEDVVAAAIGSSDIEVDADLALEAFAQDDELEHRERLLCENRRLKTKLAAYKSRISYYQDSLSRLCRIHQHSILDQRYDQLIMKRMKTAADCLEELSSRCQWLVTDEDVAKKN